MREDMGSKADRKEREAAWRLKRIRIQIAENSITYAFHKCCHCGSTWRHKRIGIGLGKGRVNSIGGVCVAETTAEIRDHSCPQCGVLQFREYDANTDAMVSWESLGVKPEPPSDGWKGMYEAFSHAV